MIRTEGEARAFLDSLCDQSAVQRLEKLVEALCIENERQNLVARSTLGDVWVRHIADSAQLLRFLPTSKSPGPWIDLGSGAGFPGLVIAAMRPDWPVHLIESRRLRYEWLSKVTVELDLRNCTVHGMRLENVSSFQASVISARAFAPLPKLLRLAGRFATPQTHWLLPKGRGAAEEMAEIAKPDVAFHVEQSITSEEAMILVGKGVRRT